MKIQIDTEKKIIKIEDNVKLSKLIETLEKFFPKGEWNEYTLETKTTITNWRSPIIIDRCWPQEKRYPWTSPYYISNKIEKQFMGDGLKPVGVGVTLDSGAYISNGSEKGMNSEGKNHIYNVMVLK